MQFILRTEAMTDADRRLADEQLGRLAQRLWQLSRAVVERWRRLTGPRGGIGAAAGSYAISSTIPDARPYRPPTTLRP